MAASEHSCFPFHCLLFLELENWACQTLPMMPTQAVGASRCQLSAFRKRARQTCGRVMEIFELIPVSSFAAAQTKPTEMQKFSAWSSSPLSNPFQGRGCRHHPSWHPQHPRRNNL